MLDFRLKVFFAVAQNLSFIKAAGELFITQPAVTKNIQELESEFDIRLFERKGSKIALTPAGNILYNYTEEILSIYRQIEFDFSVIKNKFSGQLQLGASTTVGQYVLPPILAKFFRSFPGIDISLLNDNTEKIETALLDHKIELGIVEGKTHNNQLKYIPFLKDEIVAVVHVKSKLAKNDSLTINQLKKTPVVLRERGSGTLEIIEHELSKQKIKLSDLQIAMYLGSTEGIKSFLSHTDCIGFVSIVAVAKEIANGEFKILDIKNLDIQRDFHFVHLQGKAEGLADLFMRFAMPKFIQK